MSLTGAGGSIKSKCTKSSIPNFFNCRTTVPEDSKFSKLALKFHFQFKPKTYPNWIAKFLDKYCPAFPLCMPFLCII